MDALQLMSQAEAKVREEERARQQRIDTKVGHCSAAIKNALDGLFDQIEHDVASIEVRVYYHNQVTVWTVVESSLFMPLYVIATSHLNAEYDDIGVTYTNYSPNNRSSYSDRMIVEFGNTERLGELLRSLREQKLKRDAAQAKARKEEAQKEKQARLRNLRSSLNFSFKNFVEDSEEAREIINEIVELDPAQDADSLYVDWEKEYTLYQDHQESDRREREEKAARAAAYKSKLEWYEASFKRYWEERCRLVELNKAAVEELQRELDEVLEVYDLHYAIVVCSDGTPATEVEEVICVWGKTVDGFHRVLEGHSVKPYKFENVVKTTPRYEIRITDLPYGCNGYIDLGPYIGYSEDGLCYSPLADKSQVENMLETSLTKLPERPDAGNLDHRDIRTIEGRIIRDDPSFIYQDYF